ncbi:Putative type II secretion system protein E [Stieleria maiorica]|uniref:Type II secretion system protein E n=2 Tax=Stieleria maiorica TaxID=2795974 RepID=A0A5B9MKD8_9BACT|nr:Putative type II secretion system protein E [Stieleria maiorica]
MIDFEDLDKAEGETELSPPELFAANLIEWSLERHASDLFVSDIDGAILISVRRLGRIEPVRKLARDYGRRLQGHLRVLAGADAGESVRPVEGRGNITTPDGSKAHLRLSSIPTLYGQDVSIRLFDPVRGARPLDQLGMDSVDVRSIEHLIGQRSGLILVTGPVASGKSSTLYAMMKRLNDGTRKIHTIEDPIEHALSGVMQSQTNPRVGLGFAELLTVVLRHSPDVIMIGEIRDRQTAETAIRAGASGQLVLATVHSTSTAEAVDMMLQYDSDHVFLANALSGVINQRLVRRLCPVCRKPASGTDNREVPERIRCRMKDAQPSIFDPFGCHLCHEGGYDQLIALPEIMLVDETIEAAIAKRVSATELEMICAEDGMLRLAEVAHSYVLRGLTSLDEINRAVTDPHIASMQHHSKNAG